MRMMRMMRVGDDDGVMVIGDDDDGEMDIKKDD